MIYDPTPLPLRISEAVFQVTVIEAAHLVRWKVVHFRPARVGDEKKYATPLQGDPGSPDLLMARGGRVLLVELKRHGQRPTPPQRAWLDEIGEIIGRVWTPLDWNDGTIWKELNTL